MRATSKSLFLSVAMAAIGLSNCIQPTPEVEVKPHAKNVILFIADGMGLSTITAARIFDGQSKGMSGEENVLSFETFDEIALVKTFNLDAQVPDSAGTASAMNTGLKTQIGKVNVTSKFNDAGCSQSEAQPPETLADLAKTAGLSVGIVSTARLTHATPAAVFGHARSRDFESDGNLTPEATALGCADLAVQLIKADIDLALGGGRRSFDPEIREDTIDLMQVWEGKSERHRAITKVDQLRANDTERPNILGLFSKSHMSFEHDRDDSEQPSLSEMTSYAIENLEARNTGYYLMVESGRVDHAHHATNAFRALSETQEFARAVQRAIDTTDPNETLILVTADHSHVFTIAGYPKRGNPILGLVTAPGKTEPTLDENGNPYTTLGYQNGQFPIDPDETLTGNMVQGQDYHQRVAVHLEAETHAGEDVILYAHGPKSETVRGVIDQTEIFTIMRNALNLGQ